MSYKNCRDLECEVKNQSLWIYLNRPEAMNAFSEEMIEDLVKVLKAAEKDSNIRVCVISGKGKAFCAGGDIKAMEDKTGMFAGDSAELKERYQKGIQQIPLTIESMNKPLIAMVNGAAIGAGLDLACMCDIRVASNKAKFGETFTKLALVPGDGGSFVLQRVVGYAKAMEMTLTARIYNSDDAQKMGLVNEVVNPEDLENKVYEYIESILLTAPKAGMMAKEAIKKAYHEELPALLEKLSTFQGETQRTEDHFEALKAFKEKRKPHWKGC